MSLHDAQAPAAPLTSDDFAVLGRLALLGGSSSFSGGLDDALDVLRVGAGADACELFLLDPTARELLLTACTGPDAAAFCSRERFDLGRGYPGIVATGRMPLVTRTLHRDPRYLRRDVQALGYHTSVVVPVLRGDRLLGTLHLAWKRPDPDTDRATRLLQAAAPTLAMSLVAALADLAGPELSVSVCREQALRDQAERFRRFAGADEATVLLLNTTGNGVSSCGSTGPAHLICEQRTTGSAAGCGPSDDHSRGIVLDGRRSSWPAPCRTLPRGFARVLEVPLRDGQRDIGLVALGWRKPPPGPRTRLLAPLMSLARTLAPDFREARAPSPLPAVLPPVTAAGTHHLRLQCFGPFSVFLDGSLVHRRSFSRAKAVDLLKMLILRQGRPISRDALVERLWPDAELESGARSLHVAMHALRRAVEPDVEGRQWEHVLSRGDTFLIDLGTNCALDLQEWKTLLAASRSAEADGAELIEVMAPLDRALALYRGELFADDQDAEWCLAERQAYRDQHVSTLLRLSALCERQGSPERAVSLVRQAVLSDPYREDLQRRLVQALWDAGRVEEARRQFADCLEILRQVVGVRPSANTLELGVLLGKWPQSSSEVGLCK